MTVFSVFEVGNNHCYYQAQYFTSRLSRLPPIAAWTSCRSSIFFQRGRISSTTPPTLVCGYEPTTLARLHECTQTNRTHRFTVTPDYLVAGAPKYFPLGRSRALSSTAMAGINSLIQRAWWDRWELNPRNMDFQSIALPAELPPHIKF